jgi:Galactose mutarotase and related enzymes
MIDDLLPMTNQFAIALQQKKQYKTYILSDATANSSLEVVPERGGIATSWLVEGKEIFYLDAERFANPDLTVRGGMPIQFPICGNLPDNTYTHKGVQRTLKQHGFARDEPWVAASQVTDGCAALTLVLESSDPGIGNCELISEPVFSVITTQLTRCFAINSAKLMTEAVTGA